MNIALTTYAQAKTDRAKIEAARQAHAKDSNVRMAMLDRWGAPGTKLSPGVTFGLAKDEWSALAIASTVTDKLLKGETPPPLTPFIR